MRATVIRFALLIFLTILFAQCQKPQRCEAITKAGTQCKRNAQSGSVFCWQHTRMYGTERFERNPPVSKENKEVERGKDKRIELYTLFTDRYRMSETFEQFEKSLYDPRNLKFCYDVVIMSGYKDQNGDSLRLETFIRSLALPDSVCRACLIYADTSKGYEKEDAISPDE